MRRNFFRHTWTICRSFIFYFIYIWLEASTQQILNKPFLFSVCFYRSSPIIARGSSPFYVLLCRKKRIRMLGGLLIQVVIISFHCYKINSSFAILPLYLFFYSFCVIIVFVYRVCCFLPHNYPVLHCFFLFTVTTTTFMHVLFIVLSPILDGRRKVAQVYHV